MNGGADAGRWLAANRDSLAVAVTDLQYERVPGLEARFGPAGRARCEEDAGHHLDYLRASVVRDARRLFLDYVAWAKALLASLGIGEDDLRTNLSCVRDALLDAAPEAHRAALVDPVADALAQLADMPTELPSRIDPAAPHAGLARRYLDAMLGGQRHEAMQLVVDAAAGGVPVREIYLHVFAPVQHEIGRLWQHNEISVAEEHYCTAVTQLVISQLYPYIFAAERNGRVLVATCVSGDLHEVGVRMVADFFEMEGWDTYYLGASVPTRDIVKTVADKGAEIVAISATISRHVDAVAELVQQLRSTDATRETRVLVGGYPFNVDPELWRQVGADGSASDADEAIALAERLLGARLT